MTSLKTFKVKISGRVQGVLFRATAKDMADGWGLTGWTRNEPGDNLSIVVQGPAVFVDRFLKWCHQGPPHSRIDKIEIIEDADAELYEGFQIRY